MLRSWKKDILEEAGRELPPQLPNNKQIKSSKIAKKGPSRGWIGGMPFSVLYMKPRTSSKYSRDIKVTYTLNAGLILYDLPIDK